MTKNPRSNAKTAAGLFRPGGGKGEVPATPTIADQAVGAVDRSVAILRRRALLAESLTRRRLRRWRFGAFVGTGFDFNAKCLAAFRMNGVAAESAVGPFKGDTDIGMRRVLDRLDAIFAGVRAFPAVILIPFINHIPSLYRYCDSRNVKIARFTP